MSRSIHLHHRYTTRQQLAFFLVFAALIPLAFFILLLNLLPTDKAFPELVAKVVPLLIHAIPEAWQKDPVNFILHSIMFVTLLPLTYYLIILYPIEQLILTDTGIRFHSPLPKFLQWLRPSWSMNWSDLDEVKLTINPRVHRIEAVQLRLMGKDKPRLIKVSEWYLRHANAQFWWNNPLFKPMFISTDKHQLDTQLRRSPLLKGLNEFGVTVIDARDEPVQHSGFDLNATPQTQRVLLAMALLGLYAAIDTVVSNETYANTPPYLLITLAGVLLAVTISRWLLSCKIPKAESIGMGFLIGVIFSVALYPGLLRINQLTGEKLHQVEYRLGDDKRLYPVIKGYPVIDLTEQAPDYWGAQKEGKSYTIMLHKGGLGFFQFDQEPLYAKYQQYYNNK